MKKKTSFNIVTKVREEDFRRLWSSSVNVYERTQALREMSESECLWAIRVDDDARRLNTWYQLQPTVRHALESRLRRLIGKRP